VREHRGHSRCDWYHKVSARGVADGWILDCDEDDRLLALAAVGTRNGQWMVEVEARAVNTREELTQQVQGDMQICLKRPASFARFR